MGLSRLALEEVMPSNPSASNYNDWQTFGKSLATPKSLHSYFKVLRLRLCFSQSVDGWSVRFPMIRILTMMNENETFDLAPTHSHPDSPPCALSCPPCRR